MTPVQEGKLKPGGFVYQNVCCGLAWGKPLAVIARICRVSLATVKRIERERKEQQ